MGREGHDGLGIGGGACWSLGGGIHPLSDTSAIGNGLLLQVKVGSLSLLWQASPSPYYTLHNLSFRQETLIASLYRRNPETRNVFGRRPHEPSLT
jgi:hypothetical protein